MNATVAKYERIVIFPCWAEERGGHGNQKLMLTPSVADEEVH
jgi:hypothetical protein